MNYEKYKDKGLSGLTNLGNTCFLNSTMQLLSHTYELNEFLNAQTYKKRLNNKYDSILLVEWDNLRQLLWNENCVVTPNKFLITIQQIANIKNNQMFGGFEQNDLTEFLTFIIDCFHNALTREVNMTIEGHINNDIDKIAVTCFKRIKEMFEKDYSEIWRMFYGILVSQTNNAETNILLNMIPEPIFIINLPIPNNIKTPTLIDCFDLYVEEELIDGDNCLINETTKEKIAIKKKLMFWSLPDVLVLDIKRFNNLSKNQILVDFPLEELNLSKYIIGYNKETYVYDLYGVGNHIGHSIKVGHYTSFVKNANGKWYHYNDNVVNEILMPSQIITPSAYIFFYRKRQT
jgi:ubiquitin carboxyl-terminal hydrolase 8